MRTFFRCSTTLVLLALIIAAGGNAYAQLEPHGIGGGGYLTSAAIHPSDPSIAVVGGDVCGIFRTNDFGLNWFPWIEGLNNPDDAPSFYVDDLVGVSRNGWNGFYATTRAGIYCAKLSESWVWMTTAEKGYTYKPVGSGFNNRADVIPFSCIDWDGADLMVAGAGQVRWQQNAPYPDETDNYPGLPAIDTGIPGGTVLTVTDQWPLWTLDLVNPNAEWLPDTDASAARPQGTARDVSVASVKGDSYIVLATSQSVYLRHNGQWSDLSTVDGFPVTPCFTQCWSVHVTEYGALYAAFNYDSELGCISGVYKIVDLDDPQQWVHVGGHPGPGLPPSGQDMRTIGVGTQLIYLGVGEDVDQDYLYLGARLGQVNLNVGLYRTTLDVADTGYHAQWEHVVYRTAGMVYNPPGFDTGWSGANNPRVLFEPAVSPVDPQQAIVQFHTWLHTTSDGGATWDQRYTIESGAAYTSRGYNELVVWGLDPGTGGNLVTGTADYGIFRSTDAGLTAFRWLQPPVASPPSCDEAWQLGALYAHSAVDWRGSGEEILVVASGNRTGDRPGKLFWVDPTDTWHGITCTLPDADRYIFHDFVLKPGVVWVPYEKHDAQVSATSHVIEAGVLRGDQLQYPCGGCVIPSTDPGVWVWSTENQGLVTDGSLRPAKVIANDAAGTLFMIAHRNGAQGGLPGGLFFVGENGWTQLLPGASAPFDGAQDFWSIAQSQDGGVIYAGTNGNGTGAGMVVKFDVNQQPDPQDPSTWTPVAISDGLSFGFTIPFYRDGLHGIGGWPDDETAGNVLTWVRALAVDLGDPNIVYAGLHHVSAFPQEGVWRYDGHWTQLPEGEPIGEDPMQGLGVYSLCVSPANSGELIIGTQGQELYTFSIPASSPGPTGEQMPDIVRRDPQSARAASPRLRMLGASPNPAGGATQIRFDTDAPEARVRIYDVTGRLVKTIDVRAGVGNPTVVAWDGADDRGTRVPSGVYFAHVRAGALTGSSRIVLLR